MKQLIIVIGAAMLVTIAVRMVMDATATHQTFASRANLTMSECIASGKAYGGPLFDAETMCREMVPKR